MTRVHSALSRTALQRANIIDQVLGHSLIQLEQDFHSDRLSVLHQAPRSIQG